VLHRFDTPVVAVAPFGGISGQALLAELEREGVSVRAVATDAATRRSMTLWVSATREHFRILVEGDPLEERAWRACLAAVGELERPEFVVLSGRLPPGVPAAVVEAFAEAARSLGSRFVCDTSGPALGAAVAAGADLVKPSVGELRDLVAAGVSREDFDYREGARQAVALGVRAIVVSLGADGAFLAARDGTEAEFRSPPVEVLSSVGAGDSMVAGILLGLLRDRSLPAAVRLGVAAGTATCMQHGTELCLPDDVERLDAELARQGY
jgi:6-phosphofructokinase 2